jgi:hypothetical protein
MVTAAKGESKTIQWTLFEKQPTDGSTPVPSNISGATIIFSVFNNKNSLDLLYRANGTIVDATNGVFTVPITTDITKHRGTLFFTIWATYANGNNILWVKGDFTVTDDGSYS